MIWGEVIGGEEIGAKNSTLNVCYDKIEAKRLSTNFDGTATISKTGNIRTVGGSEFDVVCALKALLGSGRKNGQ